MVVAWEHKAIPLIASELMGEPSAVPAVWPDDRFDLLWICEPDPSGTRYGFRQVPELLLAGDRDEPT